MFAEPWWLEAVAPGRWGIARVERNGELQAAWPYSTERMLGGLVRLGAPPLTPYLGPMIKRNAQARRHKQVSESYSLIDSLYEQLPKYDICKFNLRVDQGPWFGLHRLGFEVRARQTYLLDELSDLDSIWANFHSATRGAIRKAEKILKCDEATDVADLWLMVSGTFDRQGMKVPYDRTFLERCVAAAMENHRGRVMVARDEEGAPHAASFVVWDDERAYYLVGGADPNRRESAGLSLLAWKGIQHAAENSKAFDFEGSMVPGIERFFSRFGGRPETNLEAIAFSDRGRVAWSARNTAMRFSTELESIRSRIASR